MAAAGSRPVDRAGHTDESGEDRLLRRILSVLPALPAGGGGQLPRLLLGPGDDAAAFAWPGGGTLLLTTDAAEEGVHFDRSLHPPRPIGRRAVAGAVSDIAAMGGRPTATLVSLVTPPAEEAVAARIAEAAGERARELGAPLVGGNITAGERIGLHVAVAGRVAPGAPLLRRRGAKPGDGLFVTGNLGGAALGLALLQRRETESVPFAPEEEALVARQLDPAPRLAAGAALAAAAHAGMDLSDGLALDLHRLAAASGVGARVEETRLPLAGKGARGLEAALFGGEDYELLVAGPAEQLGAAARQAEIPLIQVGSVTGPDEGIRLERAGGATEPLPRRGWDSWAGR
ncbi:MAG: thiamine-phosphate kinase [Acidobacteria bacterium]|nr:thiamine-phosphate kinase [Acidobacteriota bacterium]MYK80917.1 thiamine-phosphate kinase [Acidobacteriota bacterium]